LPIDIAKKRKLETISSFNVVISHTTLSYPHNGNENPYSHLSSSIGHAYEGW
jgi:hypothetical protein